MSSTTELSKFNHCKNLAQWQQMVYDCRNSGMTVRAWCAAQGISEKSYYYRQRKVLEAAQQADVNKQTASLPSSALYPFRTVGQQHHRLGGKTINKH